MSDITSKLVWKRWYPEELSSLQCVKKTTYITYKDQLLKNNHTNSPFVDIKEEFYDQKEDKIYKKNYQKNTTKGVVDCNIKTQKNVLEYEKKQQIVQEKINMFLSDFKSALDSLDSIIPTRLIHLTLKIIAKIIGENPLIKTSFILNRIKEIIRLESMHFYKPKLIIHPDDNDLIKKKFGKIFSMHGWSISCDNRIKLGGCKIESEDSNLDATVVTLWHELCRLSFFNEND